MATSIVEAIATVDRAINSTRTHLFDRYVQRQSAVTRVWARFTEGVRFCAKSLCVSCPQSSVLI